MGIRGHPSSMAVLANATMSAVAAQAIPGTPGNPGKTRPQSPAVKTQDKFRLKKWR
jgi:hypothetical protein